MPIQVDLDAKTCTLEAEGVRESGPATDVRVETDIALSMSMAVLHDKRVPITEAEADALTVAGAVDERCHVKASQPGSVI